MRRVAMAMFLIGGLTSLSGVWITQSTPESQLGQGVVSGLVLAAGLVVAAWRHVPRVVLEGSVMWSIVLLGGLVALSDPLGMAPFFFLWPVVFAAYFSSTGVGRASFLLMAVSLAVGLIVNDAIELKLDVFIGTTATVGLMGVLVSSLTQRERALRRELAVAAETDPLTGLLNRRSFNPRLAAVVADAGRSGRPLTVLMFDLDHFKVLNDTHGHAVGDIALRQVAVVLAAQSRQGDLVSRFGGEEFAVALPGASVAAAQAYAERVATALAELVVADGAGVAVSGGICAWSSGVPPDLLLSRSDEALYAAKQGGRSRSAVWGDEITVGPRFGTPASV
ncbi:MAG: GGDEF domain-containing protein [Acidimicrobiales bacterium]